MVRLCVKLSDLNTFRNIALQEGCPVLLVAQIHLEVQPRAVLQNSHPPTSLYRVRELPQDVIALLVRETFPVGLKDAASLREDRVLDVANR